jgi:hypothetical protein
MGLIYLDYEGDSPCFPGVVDVRTERDFFRLALSNESLLIRGEELCRWAASFYQSRGIEVMRVSSPSRVLQRLIPQLSEEQARELTQRFTVCLHPSTNLVDIISYLWPFFDKTAVGEHAIANWLVLKASPKRSRAEEVVVEAYTDRLRSQYPAYFWLFQQEDVQEVFRILLEWLRILRPRQNLSSSSFPLTSLPNNLQTIIDNKLRELVVELKQNLLTQVIQQAAPEFICKHVAAVCQEYFLHHADELNAEILRLLKPYLSLEQAHELESRLPLPPPTPLPQQPLQLIKWFKEEYLPYLVRNEHDSTTLRRAREFADFYLDFYAQALVGCQGRDLLIFERTQALHETASNRVNFIVVLDGLNYADMLTLAEHLEREAAELLAREKADVVFAALPTVTEYAKQALFRGCKPSLVDERPILGEVARRTSDVRRLLTSAQPGNVIFWNVLEPDKIYHEREEIDGIHDNVQAALHSQARKIIELVNSIAHHGVELRLIITTDHGRLIGTSERTYPAPSGMTPYARAAWGGTELCEPKCIRDNIALLHRDTYGMTMDFAVVLDQNAFVQQDGRGGRVNYTHGGVFPEEVLIPWWSYLVNVRVEPPRVELTGLGIASQQGTIDLTITNITQIPLYIERLEIRFSDTHEVPLALDIQLSPLSRSEIRSVPLAPWPSQREIENAEAYLHYYLPNGRLEVLTIKPVALQTRELYAVSNNPLEDLRDE